MPDWAIALVIVAGIVGLVYVLFAACFMRLFWKMFNA